MLYENEKIKLWDPETNELSGKDEVIDEEVRRIIDEGYALIALKNSNGWQLLENLLKTTCSDLKEKLTYEQDLERFRRLQEAVKAYQSSPLCDFVIDKVEYVLVSFDGFLEATKPF